MFLHTQTILNQLLVEKILSKKGTVIEVHITKTMKDLTLITFITNITGPYLLLYFLIVRLYF